MHGGRKNIQANYYCVEDPSTKEGSQQGQQKQKVDVHLVLNKQIYDRFLQYVVVTRGLRHVSEAVEEAILLFLEKEKQNNREEEEERR